MTSCPDFSFTLYSRHTVLFVAPSLEFLCWLWPVPGMFFPGYLCAFLLTLFSFCSISSSRWSLLWPHYLKLYASICVLNFLSAFFILFSPTHISFQNTINYYVYCLLSVSLCWTVTYKSMWVFFVHKFQENLAHSRYPINVSWMNSLIEKNFQNLVCKKEIHWLTSLPHLQFIILPNYFKTIWGELACF